MLGTTVIFQAIKFLCYRANTFHSFPSTVEGALLHQIIYRHRRETLKHRALSGPFLVATLGCSPDQRPLEHQEIGASQAHPSSSQQDGTTLLSPLFLNLIQIWLRSVGGWNLAPEQCNLLFAWCWAPKGCVSLMKPLKISNIPFIQSWKTG